MHTMSQTRMRSEREGRKDKSAGLLTRLDQGKHTKRRASPTSFYLPIDDRFRLTVDERCWRIEQRRKDDEWRPVEYHTTLAAAIKRLSGRLQRTAEVQCLADALAAVENIARTLMLALAPHFYVARRTESFSILDEGVRDAISG
jgi:hypothetical protein